MTFTLDDLPSTPTPKDYLRLNFDPSQLPHKRIVGFLACQRDPLLRNLKSRVISSREASLTAVPVAKGKSGNRTPKPKGKSASNSGAATPNPNADLETKGKLWEVRTEDTPIFPEGGGQPSDTGTLYVTNPNGEKKGYKVEMCLRKGLDAVHLVRVPEGEALNFDGQEVELEVDWDRRQDHMSIHTAQHLLSAVLDNYAEGLPTLSWSLAAYPSTEPPYIELPRALTWAEAEEVENRCNALIREGRRVWVEVGMQEEVDVNGDGRDSRGIPMDYQGGVIRHINIDGIDRNACCGTQVPSLTHCGLIHVVPPSTPSTSSNPSKSPTKLYFTAGPRGLAYLLSSSRHLSLTAQVLSVSRNELADRAGRMDEQRVEAVNREKGVRGELAKLLGEKEADRLLASGIKDQIPSQSHDDEASVVWIKREDRSTHDFDFLSSITSFLLDSTTSLNPKPVVVCTSALPGVEGGLLLVQSFDQDTAKTVNEKLKFALDALVEKNGGDEGDKAVKGKGRVKGGGARGRFMSKIEGKVGKIEYGVIEKTIQGLREERAKV